MSLFLILADVPATSPAIQGGDAALKSDELYIHLESWIPHTHQLIRGLAVGGSILLLGLALIFVLRKLLRRAKLITPSLVFFLTLALYVGIAAMKPYRMADSHDELAYWLHRTFIAAFVYVALRLLDRLLIVPIMSRGGRVKVPHLLHQILNIILAVFALLIYGSYAFGWDIDKFLAGSAVVSIVLGLALQETLGNFFSGLVMQGSPPFLIGDYIACGPYEGRVVDMTWRATTIITNDDNYVMIPNATVSKADIVNYHFPSRSTARSVKVGLEYDLPPCDAVAVLLRAAAETDGVCQDPPPVIYVSEFADSAITYTVKFWINEPHRHLKIETAVRTNIWYRLKEKNYGIPFPMQVQVADKTRDQRAEAARRAAVLDSVPLFAPLSPEQKLALAESSRDLALAPGQTLFSQNDPGESFYIIASGQVQVLINTPTPSTQSSALSTQSSSAAPQPAPQPTLTPVATLNPGDFFGEMSALTGQPRTATIRALTPITLIEISKPTLHSLFASDPTILEKVSDLITQRNAHREATAQNAPAPTPATLATAKESLLSRMARFFRIKH